MRNVANVNMYDHLLANLTASMWWYLSSNTECISTPPRELRVLHGGEEGGRQEGSPNRYILGADVGFLLLGLREGLRVGLRFDLHVGLRVGLPRHETGAFVGGSLQVGTASLLGGAVGSTIGAGVRQAVGTTFGAAVGADVDSIIGAALGDADTTFGAAVGAAVESIIGAALGDADTTFGAALGDGVPLTLGAALGAPVRLSPVIDRIL